MKQLMNGDITKMATRDLEENISHLEDCYAELLGDDEDKHTIHSVWLRLNELKSALAKKKS